MKNEEKDKEVSTQDFIQSLANSNLKLANNGKNTIRIQIDKGFPKTIHVQTVTLKRVMNNFITNSLKHTIEGEVVVYMDLSSYCGDTNANTNEDINEINFNQFNCSQKYSDYNIIHNPLGAKVHTVGSTEHIDKNTPLLRLSVYDNGSGIPEQSINRIFDVKYSDEDNFNWDGIGLGLPICAKLVSQMGAYIEY